MVRAVAFKASGRGFDSRSVFYLGMRGWFKLDQDTCIILHFHENKNSHWKLRYLWAKHSARLRLGSYNT